MTGVQVLGFVGLVVIIVMVAADFARSAYRDHAERRVAAMRARATETARRLSEVQR